MELCKSCYSKISVLDGDFIIVGHIVKLDMFPNTTPMAKTPMIYLPIRGKC